ncbi:M81 family metallopeptidase [Aquabacterium humicola]|uniref:M81 family metallopeptidase n=1 Tax=Aquabacterium humicola TaxID=3237377 RepID=UPI002543B645|nr:M81 family metallopeptidase [Rubrivivax pictus]
MTRIFIAGFQHETNTFAPSQADWAAFNRGSSYPAYARGDAMVELIAPGSLPLSGFITAARERGWTLVPSVWAGATPSAHVTKDAFERIAAEMVEDLRAAAGRIDGILLDLHGAGVAEHVDDTEGELLERLRAVVGPDMPLIATLDLHANVSERMLRHADAFFVYRTYPHVDMRERGHAAVAAMARRLAPGARPLHTASRRLPYLLPLNTQCTLLEPAAGLMRTLDALEREHGVQLEFAMGFPAADIADCGPVVFGHGEHAAAVGRAVEALAAAVNARRSEFALQWLLPRDAVREALQRAQGASAPVVIADTQDNPGAGGDSNTTGMLHALLAEGAGRRFPGRIALGLLFDPDAAAAAHAAGVGTTLTLTFGRSVKDYRGEPTDAALTREVRVEAISDGTIPLHGPMTAGSTVRLGPCARIDVDGVQVLLASAKCQMLDLDLCRFLGVQPSEMAVIVVKSSVHFRAAFQPIAHSILVAKAPGPMAADPEDLAWTKLPATTARRP